jgi:preprotein translocase subunit SecG
LFGAAGSGNFFTKSTWVLAFTLFGICLALGYINNHREHGNAAFDNIEEGVQTESAQVSQPAPVENSDSKAAVKVEKVEPPAAEKAAEKTVPEDNKNTASEASSDEKADQQ